MRYRSYCDLCECQFYAPVGDLEPICPKCGMSVGEGISDERPPPQGDE